MHISSKSTSSFLIAASLAVVIGCGSCSGGGKTSKATETVETKVTAEEEIFYADPTIFPERTKYYLSGTRNRKPAGFSLLESDDLTHWKPAKADSMILRAGQSTFGTKGFWAPQIINEGKEYWLSYTADEQTVLAKADALTGLYQQQVVEPIDGSAKNIDSFLYKDDNGKWYLYHVRFNNGNFLWVAEFDPSTGKLIDNTLTRCFINDQPWEKTADYESAPIMEGPTLLKIDNTYYLFYSANHFMSRDYAVGYATSDSPLGPWKKNPNNPIIHRSIVGENGSGHGDVFVDNAGKYRYVYHVHYSDSVVSPRRTRIVSLYLEKNEASGLYDITADPSTVIIPKVAY